MSLASDESRFSSFAEFYAFYLREHSRASTRALHVLGTLSCLGALLIALLALAPIWIPIGIASGYALAWLSHFLLEGNRPATFRHPFYSLIADFRMALEILTGRRPLREPTDSSPPPTDDAVASSPRG